MVQMLLVSQLRVTRVLLEHLFSPLHQPVVTFFLPLPLYDLATQLRKKPILIEEASRPWEPAATSFPALNAQNDEGKKNTELC